MSTILLINARVGNSEVNFALKSGAPFQET